VFADGEATTSAYHAGFGDDAINATGARNDLLQFDSNIFSDWAHLLGAAQQQGSDLPITFDAADTITLAPDTIMLENVALAHSPWADATFV